MVTGTADRLTHCVSVIVTTRNSARTLEACLASIRRQAHPDVELIVVDNNSSDDTVDIADRYSDIVATKGPERSAQRNYGAELSRGEVLVFIDSDMVLEDQVLADGALALQQAGVRGVVIPERSFGEGFWTKCRMLERQCYTGDDTVEAARIYKRSDFFAVGGFDLALNGPEDWDLSRRITAGTTVPRTDAIIHHDEGRTTLPGCFVKRRYYAPGYLRYLRKHRGSALDRANPVLRSAFLRHWRTLIRHPVMTPGMFVLKAVDLGAVLQVAAEQYVLRRSADRFGEVYQNQDAARDDIRPLMLTFGSVQRADGGVQTRARLTAETFAELGVPMTVVSTREPAPGETPTWAARLRVPLSKPVKGFSPELVRLIRAEAASNTMVLITNAMFMPAIAAARITVPLVWDTNECQTLHYRRLPGSVANRAKLAVWFLLERWAAHRCTLAIAIGEEEAETWRATHPALRTKLAVVDHAVLATPRDPAASRRALESRLGRHFPGPVLVFLGTLRAKHNAAAARWIVDQLAPQLPDEVTIVLCGPDSDILSRPPGRGAAVVGLGAVEDADEVVAAADFCLAPLSAGAGVKTKVLHYLAHGKRVAGTATAFEGVEGAPGLYAAPLEDFAGLVEGLLRSEESAPDANERARSEQEWLDRHHGRKHIAAQWKKVLECLSSTTSG